MLKSQREAAPSEAANSPAKPSANIALEETQKVVRIKPQSIALETAPIKAPQLESDLEATQKLKSIPASPKKSVSGRSDVAPSPIGEGAHMSMM